MRINTRYIYSYMARRRRSSPNKLDYCFFWTILSTLAFLFYQYRTVRIKVDHVSHDSYFEKHLRSSSTSVPKHQLKSLAESDDIRVSINVISLSGVKGADEHNQKTPGAFSRTF